MTEAINIAYSFYIHIYLSHALSRNVLVSDERISHVSLSVIFVFFFS